MLDGCWEGMGIACYQSTRLVAIYSSPQSSSASEIQNGF